MEITKTQLKQLIRKAVQIQLNEIVRFTNMREVDARMSTLIRIFREFAGKVDTRDILKIVTELLDDDTWEKVTAELDYINIYSSSSSEQESPVGRMDKLQSYEIQHGLNSYELLEALLGTLGQNTWKEVLAGFRHRLMSWRRE